MGRECRRRKLLSTVERLSNTKLRLFEGTTGRMEPKWNNCENSEIRPFSPLKNQLMELILSSNRRGISRMSIGSGNGRIEEEWGRINGDSEIIPPTCRLCEELDRPAGNAQADCLPAWRAGGEWRASGGRRRAVRRVRLFRSTARWPNRQPLHQNA